VGKIKEMMKILRKSPDRTELEHCIYFRHTVAELSLFCLKTEKQLIRNQWNLVQMVNPENSQIVVKI